MKIAFAKRLEGPLVAEKRIIVALDFFSKIL